MTARIKIEHCIKVKINYIVEVQINLKIYRLSFPIYLVPENIIFNQEFT